VILQEKGCEVAYKNEKTGVFPVKNYKNARKA